MVAAAAVEPIVIDTNIILDLFVFGDPATVPLRQQLDAGELGWVATQPMCDELERVLAYPQIVPRLAYYRRSAGEVLAQFDQMATLKAVAVKAALTCSDPDDQKFIDLAVSWQALLLSKDRAVLSMLKRLLQHGVRAQAAMN